MVYVITLVAEDRRITQDEKTVSESARNEKLATVLSGEDHPPLPPAISLAAGPKINANVKDLTLDNPYELALRVINLEVQSTKDPLCAGRLIVLHELAINAAGDKSDLL